MSKWGGRKVRRLTVLVLANKGTVCHLCGGPGADSPDHDPPRSVLVARGVPDPDALAYLWPAHLLCNQIRRDRPLTPALLAEVRARRAVLLARRAARADLSPRFAARRPGFSRGHTASEASPSASPPGNAHKIVGMTRIDRKGAG